MARESLSSTAGTTLPRTEPVNRAEMSPRSLGETTLRQENTQPTWPTNTVSVDGLSVSHLSLSSNTSQRSTESERAQIGHLVRRAMSLFETNRAMAWRCLSDASSLLGVESHETSTVQSLASITLKPGGLAVWQARRALAYIDANLGSKISITEISALMALSKSHFCRAFKHTLGTSPMAYISARRIERVKTLITSTSERLSDIALACGFADQSHLNRSFGRMVGMSPGLWRRNNQHRGPNAVHPYLRADSRPKGGIGTA
jgi:AraC family transcriptional regulator